MFDLFGEDREVTDELRRRSSTSECERMTVPELSLKLEDREAERKKDESVTESEKVT